MNMKKFASAALAGALILSSAAMAVAETYQVGILQLVQHPALDAATEGFKTALTEKLGENVVFTERNAAGDAANCGLIAKNLVSNNVDLLMANATPALTACYEATETIPILGTSVTEYGVALGIEGFTGVVGSNVSGTSDLAPLDQQAAMIVEWFPEAKTCGLLYCSGEANSDYQVQTIKGYLEDLGVACTLYSFTDSNDVIAVTRKATECDVIYIPTDNTCASNTEAIAGVVLDAKKPVIAGEEGICSGCGVATLTISYYDIGYATGNMAYQILAEGADITTMPIEYAPQFTKKYNKEICDELGITVIPEGYEAM